MDKTKFGNQENEDFFNQLLFVDNFNTHTIKYTKYNTSCFLESHTDYIPEIHPSQLDYELEVRLLSIIYYTSDYIPGCGGELVWNGEIPSKTIYPRNNNLYMFIPRKLSEHRIKDVTCGARHAISGWLTSNKPTRSYLQLHNIMEYNLIQ